MNFNKKQNTIYFTGILILIIIMNIIGIITKNSAIVSISTPLVYVMFIVTYVMSVKQINKLALSYQTAILIAEILNLFNEQYFLYVAIFYLIGQVALIVFIIKLKHIKVSDILVYFVLLLICFAVVNNYILSAIKGYSILILVYGLTVCIVTSLALTNYLRKMYMGNFLLWLGVAFALLNTAILSLDLFNSSTNILVFILNIISNYLICYSFISRVNRLPKKSK